jgi:TRAP transporter TAXI family solute receptor
MEEVMAVFGWQLSDFALAMELESSQQAKALCMDRFDAMVFTVGHPNSSVGEASSSCDTHLVTVAGPQIDRLLAEKPYYLPAVIPGGLYRGTEHDVQSFGVVATLVTSAEVEEEVIYQLVKAVFENFAEFRAQHPALAKLKKTAMCKAGLTAPLHRGARKYYQEIGLR